MTRRFFLAKLRGDADASGIILPDCGDRARVVQRAAELLAHLNAAAVRADDVELLPYYPPEHERIRLDSKAA